MRFYGALRNLNTRLGTVMSIVYKLLLAFAFVLVSPQGCKDTPTFPTPPPEPPPVVEAPRVDQPFSWEYYQGFTAFALGSPEQAEYDVQSLFAGALSHGWNTARICSETENWDNSSYLVRKPRDTDRLEWLLDLIARIPGTQVLLIGDCTLKGPVPEPEKREWARQVAQVARKFQNVAIETHNEFDVCRGRDWGPHCPGKDDVAAHIRIYKEAGIQYVTANDSLCAGPDERKTYQFRLANIGAYPADFHPCRNVRNTPWDPSRQYLQRLVELNSGIALLSETVAFGDVSGNCSGLRTCDKLRIEKYIADCAAVPGCKFTYHSEALLAGWPPGWWPEAR